MNTSRRKFNLAAAFGFLGSGAGSRLLAQSPQQATGGAKFFKDPTFQFIFTISLGQSYYSGETRGRSCT